MVDRAIRGKLALEHGVHGAEAVRSPREFGALYGGHNVEVVTGPLERDADHSGIEPETLDPEDRTYRAEVSKLSGKPEGGRVGPRAVRHGAVPQLSQRHRDPPRTSGCPDVGLERQRIDVQGPVG